VETLSPKSISPSNDVATRFADIAIDTTHIKAHRSASGAKKGNRRRRSAARAVGERARSTRFLMLSVGRSHWR
jgi:hypothetical protein